MKTTIYKRVNVYFEWSDWKVIRWHTSLLTFTKQSMSLSYGERYCQLICVPCLWARTFTEFFKLNSKISREVTECDQEIGKRGHLEFSTSILESKHAYLSYQVIRSVQNMIPGSDAIKQIEWLDTMNVHALTRVWMSKILIVRVHKFPDHTQWKISETACSKAWHYSSR